MSEYCGKAGCPVCGGVPDLTKKAKAFFWVSRHRLTPDQRSALEGDYDTIVEYGDIDAFSYDQLDTLVEAVEKFDSESAVGCVHPLLAMRLLNAGVTVAVADNRNRAPEGEKPQFEFNGWVLTVSDPA